MVKAVSAIRRNARRATAYWELLAFVLGLGYPTIKFFVWGGTLSRTLIS
jgi:heme/copper-type cytochrome/quinol oxidase subunit 3